MRYIYLLLLLISAAAPAMAQDSLVNGGFETWHGGFFEPGRIGCCGAALAVPDDWAVPENLMAMPTNQFVFREEDTAYVHSGNLSAELLTDITTMDSAGDVAGGLAVLVPGSVTCAGILGYGGLGMTGDLYQTNAYSIGAPFTGSPGVLFFYMMFNHDVTDTARYAYALTRWDSVNQVRDTLASDDVDIPDGGYQMMQWLLFSDTIRYVQAGVPDTLHLIFFGGRNADPNKAGNVTWLDDVSFDKPVPAGVTTATTGIAALAQDPVSVYPNPTSAVLHVSAEKNMAGYGFDLYDLTGNKVMQEDISGTLCTYSVTGLADGIYLYRILDPGGNPVSSGKVTIAR